MPQSVSNIYGTVWTALLVALIAVGALTTVPFGPVPFTLQGLFIALAALVLGPARGAAAVILYIVIGIVGLPVFSGGSSGVAVFMGPTAGYLVGYVLLAAILGFGGTGWRGLEGGVPPLWRTVCLAVLAELVLFVCGALWLMRLLDIPMEKAFVVGVLPFLPPDALKIAAAIAAWRFLLRQRLLPR